MRLVGSEQMRRIDERAIQMGMPGVVLMDHAGRAVAEVAISLGRKSTLVLAGTGNNGGDGFVAARCLQEAGWPVQVMLVGDPLKVKGDALTHMRLMENAGLTPQLYSGWEALAARLGETELVIDALCGTGLNGPLRGQLAEVVERLNEQKKFVLAVDVPSGLDADQGRLLGPCVQATVTVTLADPKPGLFIYPAAGRAGRVVVAGIGMPAYAYQGERIKGSLLTGPSVREWLPPFAPDTHKGQRGRVLLVAGAQGLTGAACLCGEAAARAGAGLVTVAAPASVHDILEVKLTEVMTAPLPDEGGKVAATAVEHLPELAAGCGALAVGPGLGVSAGVKKVVASCLALDVPLVIDADGLNVLAGMVEIIKSRNKATVLTPHPGEAARLLGRDTAAVQAARLQAACDLAECSGAVVVLKGAGTLVVAPDGRYAVNPVANPALASGGSGDVLTGLVVALLGNGLEAFAAACAAVFWHGAAAQLAAAGADRGMLAGDIISHLAAALRRVVQTPDEVLPYVRMMPLGAQGVKRLDD